MKRLLKPLIYTAAVLCLCVSCNTNNAPQPDEPFYCKINGKAWRPNKDGDFKLNVLKAEFVDNGTGFYIIARNAKNLDNFFIRVLKQNSTLTTTRLYPLYEVQTDMASYYDHTYDEYTTNATERGFLEFIEIKPDTRPYAPVYVRGKFEFEAKNKAGQIIKVTHGQFRALADKNY